MDTMSVSEFLTTFLAVMSALFVFAIGVCALIAAGLYVVDITQTKHAIRRNFPVIGRLRYLFENLGEFFRQYFFAMDREEMPFNRAQRGWVYRAAQEPGQHGRLRLHPRPAPAGHDRCSPTAPFPALDRMRDADAAGHHRPGCPPALSPRPAFSTFPP